MFDAPAFQQQRIKFTFAHMKNETTYNRIRLIEPKWTRLNAPQHRQQIPRACFRFIEHNENHAKSTATQNGHDHIDEMRAHALESIGCETVEIDIVPVKSSPEWARLTAGERQQQQRSAASTSSNNTHLMGIWKSTGITYILCIHLLRYPIWNRIN